MLEEALGAKVIEELPQAVSVYQFTHALIQETLADELSTTRWVRLHAQVAEVLEELYSGNERTHAAELAFHFGEAHHSASSSTRSSIQWAKLVVLQVPKDDLHIGIGNKHPRQHQPDAPPCSEFIDISLLVWFDHTLVTPL